MFEQFIRQVLGFINQQHGFLAPLHLLEKKLVDDSQSVEAIQAVDRQAELDCDGLYHLLRAEDRIEDQRGGIMTVELFEQRPAERRFARADFARELDKALALADAVEQVIIRLAVLRAVKQEARVGRNIKRGFFQPVIIQVHAHFLAQKVPVGTDF